MEVSMKEFDFVIRDSVGIHARPAGMLVKKAAEFSSKITISKGEKTADCKRLFAIMSLAAKQNDNIRFEIEGQDEEKAAKALQEFCGENL